MLKENEDLSRLQKFTLRLKSRTENKRILEAVELLKTEYPFEIDSEKLIIRQSQNKGYYDVYISKIKVEKENNIKQYICYASVFVLVLLTICIFASVKTKAKREKILQQRQIEAQKIENEKIVKEKEAKITALEKEYRNIVENRYGKIFSYIEKIYSVMTNGSVIENIAIDNKDFSVEVTTKDALKILKAFEESPLFCNVKMNRTTVKDFNEFVTYTGEFSIVYKELDPALSQDEKIGFYEAEIAHDKERLQRQQARQLSEYIAQIRDYLHKNGCNEQYIQLHSVDKTSEVEFFILSSSTGILKFLEQIQKTDDNLFDIKQLRIRNSEERNRIQTTVCFKSWIDLDDSVMQTEEYQDKEVTVSQIDKMFYKTPSQKKIVRTTSSAAVQKKTNAAPVKLKSLSYVGMSKLNGETLIVVKDDSMGSIYKLSLHDTEQSGNCCFVSGSGYTAKIRNEYYEVKK